MKIYLKRYAIIYAYIYIMIIESFVLDSIKIYI